ncbi:MAG: molybdate ABC transporter substrate-binding protein [Bryobacteraceae bacterium]|nr:molybdate ABC transporter substrate-binding protein [Bryobacteraceae bacterium]
MLRLPFGVALALSLLVVSNFSASLSSLSAQDPLLVAAASDLAPIQTLLQQQYPGPVTFTFGSSGMLARQIENGAPFDLFLSADEYQVEPLVKKNKVDPDSRQIYAIGRVALWSKSGAYRELGDLAKAKTIAIANPLTAPYGRAAKEVLERSGLWPQVQERVVQAETTRQAYQFAESGNADVCLTAYSLVFDQGGLLVKDELHRPLRQIGVVLNKSKKRKAAAAFLDFLLSPAGRSLLATHGFNLMPGAPTLRRP